MGIMENLLFIGAVVASLNFRSSFGLTGRSSFLLTNFEETSSSNQGTVKYLVEKGDTNTDVILVAEG